MDNLSGLLGSAGAGISTSSPSLLLLDDDCLIQIFKCLELLDFVNLAKTCVRLRNLAGDTFMPKFTVLSINDHEMYSQNVQVTSQQFSDIVSLIGSRVVTAAVFKGNDFILQTVLNNCKNLNQLELRRGWSINAIPQLQEITNLKDLVIDGCEIPRNALRRIFINNPGIKSLKYRQNNFDFKLLKFLPKLETLHLFTSDDELTVDNATNFCYLNELSELHFTSYNNCNAFLAELATKSKLAKLSFVCVVNEKTFNSLKLFENLTSLKVYISTYRRLFLPENSDFPTGLKCLSLHGIELTYRTLASLVKRHKSLEEIYLSIQCVTAESGNYSDDEDEKISGIAAAVRQVLQQRTLTIYNQYNGYCYHCMNIEGGHNPEIPHQHLFYDSKYLKIVVSDGGVCEKLRSEGASGRTQLRLIE